jgi:hypothetical protein
VGSEITGTPASLHSGWSANHIRSIFRRCITPQSILRACAGSAVVTWFLAAHLLAAAGARHLAAR